MPKSARVTKELKTKLASSKKHKAIGKKIVEKKPYIELVTALLTIPFLLSVLIVNFNTLKNINAKSEPTPSPAIFQNGGGFFAAPVGPEKAATPTGIDRNQAPCIEGIGPIDISYPAENDTITQNPITININYDDSRHCGVVWSYRINGSSWSGYDDRSVALYNLPRGEVTFDLRVKSIVGFEEKNLTRKFIYRGEGIAFPPDSPGSSESAN